MEPHGAQAVGYPRLFCGFPINTAFGYKVKGLDVSFNPVTHDMVCTTLFP